MQIGDGIERVVNLVGDAGGKPAGNRELLARCLGSTVENLPTAFRERCQKYIPSEIVSKPAWDEVVFEGDEVDLAKLPIPYQFTVDAALIGRPCPVSFHFELDEG